MEIITLQVLLSIFPHFPLITQIFKSNHIKDGIFVHCYNASQMILLQKAFNNGGIEVLTVQSHELDEYQIRTKIGVVLDTSCKGWTKVLERYSSCDHIDRINWVINTTDLYSTLQILSRYPLKINSDVILIKNKSNGHEVYEAYNTGFKSNGLFVVREIGFRNLSFAMRKLSRNDLHGAVLRCVSVIAEDLVNESYMHFLQDSRHDKPDTLHKLKFFTVIRYLQQMFNFSLNVKRTNSWGYSHNGSFDGLVGALQRQEAEFGCSPVLFKINRAQVVNYVVPTWQTKHTFLFRRPKYQGSCYLVYTRPLDGYVWSCMVALLMALGLILNVILRIKSVNAPQHGTDSSLSFIWLVICSAVCQQGIPVNREMFSARIIIFVTLMFTMLIYQFYNANVLSSLLNEQYTNIRNLNDLLESDLKVGVEDMLFNKDYFKRTTDHISLELYNKKISTNTHNNFFDAEYGMDLVKSGGFAFHVDTSAAYRVMKRTFNDREICEVSEVQLFPPQYVGAIAVKGSQYREHIAIGVIKMLESGLMSRIKSVWDSPKPPCAKTRYSTIIAVNIGEFCTAILFLACGFTGAVFILLCEIYISRIKKPTYRIRNISITRLKIYNTYECMKSCKGKYLKKRCLPRKRMWLI